jgi:hypothetical protein
VTSNPVGVTGPAGNILKLLALVGAGLIAASGLAAAVSLVVRYRHASMAERAQLKWLLYAAAVIAVALLTSSLIPSTNLQNAVGGGLMFHRAG